MRILIPLLLVLIPVGARAQVGGQPADDTIVTKDAAQSADADSKLEESDDADNGDKLADQPATGFAGMIDGVLHSGPIGMIRKGGWFMPPILLIGFLAAGVIIERYRSLQMLGTDTEALRRDVSIMLQEDRIEEALELCEQNPGPVAAILGCGLRKFLVLMRLKYDPAKVEDQVVKSMDDYSVHIVAVLEKHLPILATISSVAPMLGFLGTVSGMITSFNDIVAKMGETNIVVAAAGGIGEALLTTCFGLIVGIPAFVGYNYFISVINRFVLEVEESAADLINDVTLQMALASSEASEKSAKAV
jgi:biopolymer transport protein ExbB